MFVDWILNWKCRTDLLFFEIWIENVQWFKNWAIGKPIIIDFDKDLANELAKELQRLVSLINYFGEAKNVLKHILLLNLKVSIFLIYNRLI